MKKMSMVVVVVALVAFASSAMAGFPSAGSVKGTVKKEATKAASNAATKAMLKDYTCTWNPTSKNMTSGCTDGDIAKIRTAYETCKQTRNCTAVINVGNRDAYNWVKGKLKIGGLAVVKGTGPDYTVTFDVK